VNDVLIPNIDILVGGRDIRFREGLNVDVPKLKIRVPIPTGFVSDLASIPRFLWPILPPWGEYDRAVAVHDFLWNPAGYIVGLETGRPRAVSKMEANAIMDAVMELDNVAMWRRKALLVGVNLSVKSGYAVMRERCRKFR